MLNEKEIKEAAEQGVFMNQLIDDDAVNYGVGFEQGVQWALEQIEIQIRKDNSNTDISKLEIGDFVIFSKNVKPIPKNFTIGKLYKILDKRPSRNGHCKGAIQIRHDNDGVYWIPIENRYKRWSCK